MIKTIITLIVIVLIGALVYTFITNDNDTLLNIDGQNNATSTPNGTGATTGTSTTGTSTTQTIRNELILGENRSGNMASITRATLTEPGFVAVYRADSNSESDFQGATGILAPGTYTNLIIQMDSIAAARQMLVGVLLKDNGNGRLDLDGSDVYLGNVGTEIIADVDVVDTNAEDEPTILNNQVRLFLENATSSMNN